MKKKIFVLSFILIFYLLAGVCLRQAVAAGQKFEDIPAQKVENICDNASCKLLNPLGNNNTDPRVIIGQGIRTILGIVGSVALAVFIYGGILWLTSGGNEQRIKKGKDVILWATLGLVIIFAAYAIVGFFLGGGFLGIFFAV